MSVPGVAGRNRSPDGSDSSKRGAGQLGDWGGWRTELRYSDAKTVFKLKQRQSSECRSPLLRFVVMLGIERIVVSYSYSMTFCLYSFADKL